MQEEILVQLRDALIEGDVDRIAGLTERALESGVTAKAIISQAVKPAADVVSQRYDDGEYFLPNLVQCGDSLKVAIGALQSRLGVEAPGEAYGPRVVIATVQGDIHDIGKNLVITFLQGDGFAVEDLGVDVPAEQVIDKALETEAQIIALSCLMSVTRDGVRKVCDELESRGLRDRFRVLVGGAATNQEWARRVGCDAWAGTATDAPRAARKLLVSEKEA